VDSPRILTIDDHEMFRATLVDWLTTCVPNAVVLAAASAEEGLALARETRPQIVLMDIGLPGLSGIEATRRLLAERPDAKVVIVSIHETASHRAAAAAAGAVGYVPKSALATQLSPLLRRLLEQDTVASDGGRRSGA
jgi:DNA-binding NarL/FixJ family response regulator